jgi:hypothetical protein
MPLTRRVVGAVVACALASICGCGLTVGDEVAGSGATGTGGSSGTGEVPATGIGGNAVLAIHRIWIGDTLPDGKPSADAWKVHGFDLDGKESNAQSKDLCQPAGGAEAEDVYPDGEGGIDNGFGRNIVPFLLQLSPDLSTHHDLALHEGDVPTIVFRLADLGTDHVVTDALPSEREWTEPPPAWDGSDVWRPRSDGLTGGDLASPRARFAHGEVVVNAAGALVWRARGADDLRIHLALPGFTLPLSLRRVRVSAILSDDLGRMTEGRLGGVVDTQLFAYELSKICADCWEDTCPPAPSQNPAKPPISLAPDILLDGTQDPLSPCEGISIGLGFEAEVVRLGDVVEIMPDPCAP